MQTAVPTGLFLVPIIIQIIAALWSFLLLLLEIDFFSFAISIEIAIYNICISSAFFSINLKNLSQVRNNDRTNERKNKRSNEFGVLSLENMHNSIRYFATIKINDNRFRVSMCSLHRISFLFLLIYERNVLCALCSLCICSIGVLLILFWTKDVSG